MKYSGSCVHSRDVSLNEGFTLIEMLLNLAIAVTLISIFPLIISNIANFKAISSDNNDINVELCLRDILSETRQMSLAIEGGSLIGTDNSTHKTYSYSFHQLRLVRKVDGSGYIILLEQVKNARFFKENNHFYIQLEWKDKWRMKNEKFQIR
ncbi:hypothetical protein ERX37_02190 [Macrococcus hajekii]|uniref:Prepilin-type N-terminal cleavage/methylation domain-containing protein n=1 Tax=Macrococcus hajekii TaxID=198482 RepID=A0A4R6BM74_9STAP|nr:ComGF family competence protein [Macrococcus hajekii]TDM02919.1 hypothetical protein ERX37_02190 [Macrococcus hajekii]GGB04890.1 hypothetical protein GCM10007190_11290 [Macrococcus hajekii]